MGSRLAFSTIFRKKIREGCLFFLMIFIGQSSFAQIDSLVLHAKNIKLGMTTSNVDSLMPFRLAAMHNSGGGPWRTIYDGLYQSVTEYTDKEWNNYDFRMLFKEDRLIYLDLHFYKTQKIYYSIMDTFRINQVVNNFNRHYNASDSFGSLLISFYTKVYSLDLPLHNFFTDATVKDKKRLLAYSKSLCPEYSASAVLRLLELEKIKPFLNADEKSALKEIMASDIQIQFMVGCVYRLNTFSYFLQDIWPELKDVIK